MSDQNRPETDADTAAKEALVEQNEAAANAGEKTTEDAPVGDGVQNDPAGDR